VFLLAVLVTWFLAGMRAQMEVGSSCASGGPYVVVNACPEHTTSLVLVGMFGSALVGLLGTVPAISAGAPNLLVPSWTFTFGGMAVIFLVDAFTEEGGVVWNWLFSGVVVLLLALPGLYVMTPWQRLYDREPMTGALLSRNQWWLAYLGIALLGVGAGSFTADAWL
jgi:hypothetical protein